MLTPEDIAFHEGGHVVIAFLCGREVMSVRISDDPRISLPGSSGKEEITLGRTVLGPLPAGIDLKAPENRHLADREALIALAGHLAMTIHRGRRWPIPLSRHDLDGLTPAAVQAGKSQRGLEAAMSLLVARATLNLSIYWEKVEWIAAALLRQGSLSGEEVTTLLRRGEPLRSSS